MFQREKAPREAGRQASIFRLVKKKTKLDLHPNLAQAPPLSLHCLFHRKRTRVQAGGWQGPVPPRVNKQRGEPGRPQPGHCHIPALSLAGRCKLDRVAALAAWMHFAEARLLGPTGSRQHSPLPRLALASSQRPGTVGRGPEVQPALPLGNTSQPRFAPWSAATRAMHPGCTGDNASWASEQSHLGSFEPLLCPPVRSVTTNSEESKD